MMELAMNTNTAETTIGISNDNTGVMGTPHGNRDPGAGNLRMLIDCERACIDGHPDDGVDAEGVECVDLLAGGDAAGCRNLALGRLGYRLDCRHVGALHQALFVDMRIEELLTVT